MGTQKEQGKQKDFNLQGMKRIFREALLTADNDGNALVGDFLGDPFCMRICEFLGVDYKQYRFDTRRKTRMRQMDRSWAQIKGTEAVSVDPNGQFTLF